MKTESRLEPLESGPQLDAWLRRCGISDLRRGRDNLVAIRSHGVPADLLNLLVQQLEPLLPDTSNPDAAFNNLERFFAASRSGLALAALFQRDPEALPTLLQIFSTSQYLADLLIRDPASFDLLRLTEGQPVQREILVDEIGAEVDAAADEAQVIRVLRAFKRRETLRIAYGDFLRRLPLERTTAQISYLADAIIEAAVRAARRLLGGPQRRVPHRADGAPARFVVLALGKLGGEELNYSSDVDLIFLCDEAAADPSGRGPSAEEYFGRLARLVIKLLSTTTEQGAAYRVDMRLRPHGVEGPLVHSSAAALRYYDAMGRTWERQAFVKGRSVAGDHDLGQEFLSALQPWIYHRYLSRADIAGIRTLKRKIEKRTLQAGEESRNVKTGHGGIRDVEFVIQFLQLLNGSDLEPVRIGNVLRAIAALEQVGCLTMQERTLLTDNYVFLRRIEHHLQILFDLQTHTIPSDPVERGRLAWRLGYRGADGRPETERFETELAQCQALNRKILNHLLHDAFGAQEEVPLETEIVLDPQPDMERVVEVLRAYGFAAPEEAYVRLMELSRERVSFLSTRRCRHFLAAIAPQLLREIARTPDPDATLISLAQVSDSLGGKGALWELFSFTPATLHMYVRLCAGSPYLAGILTSHPGMIDELMDSLVLDRLPLFEELEATSLELCRAAQEIEPILQSFKNSVHLRVGVRDILGKEELAATHRCLADTAEVCLRRVVQYEYERLADRYGDPHDSEGQPSHLVILGLGKLGGREPNYHSDLDVIFLYTADGQTRRRGGGGREETSNAHFFNELTQRVTKRLTQLGSTGRLYELDARLRPSGVSGILAVPIDQFLRYFETGQGQLWERLALCKARCVYGPPPAAAAAEEAVRRIITAVPWQPAMADSLRTMRYRMQENASPANLKRGAGGTVDVEFIAQMFQLRHAPDDPEVLRPGTIEGLQTLEEHGYLSAQRVADLIEGYRLLRSVESNLRLLNTTARHDLPADAETLGKLAFLIDQPDLEPLGERCEAIRRRNRELFEAIFDEAAAGRI